VSTGQDGTVQLGLDGFLGAVPRRSGRGLGSPIVGASVAFAAMGVGPLGRPLTGGSDWTVVLFAEKRQEDTRKVMILRGRSPIAGVWGPSMPAGAFKSRRLKPIQAYLAISAQASVGRRARHRGRI